MEQALKHSKTSQEKLKSLLGLSHFKLLLKRYKDALSFSEQACSVSSNSSSAFFLKGYSQLKLGMACLF